jgi:hypothetical protein
MTRTKHTLTILPEIFSICQLEEDRTIPDWAMASGFSSITRTPEELSVVCPQAHVPEAVKQDAGWRCLKVEGPLDLSATGVLASLTNPLAQEGLSVFAVSTYDTDYLLVKALQLERAVKVLRGNGHIVKGRRLAHSAKRKGKLA